MSDAIRILVLLLIGYSLGAAHVWLVGVRREGSAYMEGYRDGQTVAGRNAERVK